VKQTGVEDRHYDHSQLSSVLSSINSLKASNKHIVICCTVMPGYCRQTGSFLIRDCPNTSLSYNPEFIAQGMPRTPNTQHTSRSVPLLQLQAECCQFIDLLIDGCWQGM
jgi:UDP-glucose 6-dehydrogenase